MTGAVLHAIFDVAAWLAAFAAGLVAVARPRQSEFPSQSFELPYIAALRVRRRPRRLSVRHAESLAVAAGGHRPLGRRRAGRRHRRGRALQWRAGIRGSHRRALRAAARRRHRGRPHRLLLRGPRRFHLRHADQRCPGASISATASRAIRCSSTRAPRWRRSRSSTSLRPRPRRPWVIDNGFYLAVGFYGAAALRLGIPQALWRADRPVQRCSTCCRSPSSLYAVVMIATAPAPRSIA